MILINIKNSNDEVYSFGSVYTPNNIQQRIQFITECNKWLLIHATNRNKMFIAGDFNIIYWIVHPVSLTKTGKN